MNAREPLDVEHDDDCGRVERPLSNDKASAFVKHGADELEIELELVDGGSDIVRIIGADGPIENISAKAFFVAVKRLRAYYDAGGGP